MNADICDLINKHIIPNINKGSKIIADNQLSGVATKYDNKIKETVGSFIIHKSINKNK